MSRIGFLIDLDGTLYRGNQVIPHAATFIQLLLDKQIPFLFLTNNSARTPEQVAHHLMELGIPARTEDVLSSAMATAAYVSKQNWGTRVYVIGEEGPKTAFLKYGFELDDKNPQIIVQGLDRQVNYDKYTIAVRAILNGAHFVMTNPDQLLPSADGFLPGSGSIGAVIRNATGIEPTIVGKPSRIIMEEALSKLGLAVADSWVIGDHVLTDIAAAASIHAPSILVLTGVATSENLEEWYAKTDARPTVIMDDLTSLITLVHSNDSLQSEHILSLAAK